MKFKNLRNKEHPIRQTIDKISGGKTLILKKNDLEFLCKQYKC